MIFGGDPFEAEATCVMRDGKSVGMGQISSGGINNLAFWSADPITTPLKQNPKPPSEPYRPDTTYITLVIGDGDSMGENKGRSVPPFVFLAFLLDRPSHATLYRSTSPTALEVVELVNCAQPRTATCGHNHFWLCCSEVKQPCSVVIETDLQISITALLQALHVDAGASG